MGGDLANFQIIYLYHCKMYIWLRPNLWTVAPETFNFKSNVEAYLPNIIKHQFVCKMTRSREEDF